MSKILILADSPTVNTGFAHIARNITRELLKDNHKIDFVGINEEGKYHETRDWENLNITNAAQFKDILGRDTALQYIMDRDYDYFFVIHDIPTILENLSPQPNSSLLNLFLKLKEQKNKKTKFIYYFPIDVEFETNQNFAQSLNLLKNIDYLIPYTNFAKNQLKKLNIECEKPIYHGLYPNEWQSISRQRKKELRTLILGENHKERELILFNGRNQWRKDIPTLIEAFAMYKKVNINAFLYLNTKLVDQGGDIRRYLEFYNLIEKEDYITRGMLNERYGVSQNFMNELYRISDIVVNPARGEGFGFSYLEAQYCEVPVIAGDVSVESELLPNEYLIKAEHKNLIGFGADVLPFKRLFLNAEDIKDKLVEINQMDKDNKLKLIKERKQWADNLVMDNIGKEFRKYFK